MYNYYNKRNLLYSILLILILAIGIGYAYLTSNLSIAGNTNVATNSWNIHFENINVTTGSVTATSEPTLSSNNTVITYTIDLNRPKEFYEFTVDVKNDGTLPGKVSISELAGISSDAAPIIDYTIAYTNGNSVNIGDILNAGAKKTIKVRVFYKDEIDPGDFPSNDLNLTLTYTLQYVQSEDDGLPTADDVIEQLKTDNSSCFIQYEGQVTDEVGSTVNALNVYFNRCADKRNIKFGGYCWQMIRTTESGGIKMIYNGDVVDGKCLSTRSNHKGVIQSNFNDQTINSSYLYGSSYTYDTTNNSFTLTDEETATWSDSTYENLIGKFTCKTSSNTCTTLFQINGYKSNTESYASAYTIGNANYAQIGTSSFNADYYSPAMVGYMFNTAYYYKSKSPGTNTYKFGSTFTYINGTYTLSGTTQDISDWATGYNTINNTHYTCWNAEGICTTISYINYTTSSTGYYYDISGGKSVSDILEEMLSSSDVNRYNSSIKGIIDAWYSQNLSTKTNMLEDTVYCNARNITSYGGFNPDGGNTASGYAIKFKNYTLNNDLSCINVTDQFAVSNNKAKLTYPVALATTEELYTLTSNNSSTYYSVLTKTGAWYWGLSPNYFAVSNANLREVGSSGNVDSYDHAYQSSGSRPVVTLSSDAVISGGTGSESDPWVVQE